MRHGRLTLVLVALNVAVYLFEAFLSGNLIWINTAVLATLGQVNYYVLNGAWWQLITAMFVHVGLIHIAFNMFFLYQLGSQLENIFGWRILLLTYFLSGLTGNLLTLFFLPPYTISAGASGALFGVVGVLIMATGILGGNIASAVLNAFILFAINSIFPGVNAYAHLGGLLTGSVIGLYKGRELKRRMFERIYGDYPEP
ncbi:rhomboid family intramembrane serine protease [Thermococcus sp.]